MAYKDFLSARDKIALQFYGLKFNQLSDEQKFDVKQGLKDNYMVTKYKSMNLLGETPKEEASRLLKARIKETLKGTDTQIIREIRHGGKGYLAGTTPYQRKMRRKQLAKSGIDPDYLYLY